MSAIDKALELARKWEAGEPIPYQEHGTYATSIFARALLAMSAERDKLRALLPPCNGTWLSGSGGHRRYAFNCKELGVWDVGMGFVCDEHKNKNGGDNDAWSWERHRDLLVKELAKARGETNEQVEQLVERFLLAENLTAERIARWMEALASSLERAVDMDHDSIVGDLKCIASDVRKGEWRPATKEPSNA